MKNCLLLFLFFFTTLLTFAQSRKTRYEVDSLQFYSSEKSVYEFSMHSKLQGFFWDSIFYDSKPSIEVKIVNDSKDTLINYYQCHDSRIYWMEKRGKYGDTLLPGQSISVKSMWPDHEPRGTFFSGIRLKYKIGDSIYTNTIKVWGSVYPSSDKIISKSIAISQQITFEKNNYDFGQVALNSEPERFLKFKNTGADTLIITSAPTTACGCDMATLKDKKMIYAPSEEGTLIYKFDTKSPRKYDNIITIQTNGDAAFTAIRVKWEVLSDSLKDWERKINNHPTLNAHLDSLAKVYCYMRLGNSLEMPVINIYDGPCDSIKNVSVEEMGSLFISNELVEIFKNSKNYLTRLISFEALTRTNYSADSLEILLETLIVNSEQKYSEELIRHFLDLVSPSKNSPLEIKKYSISTKIDLDDFIYLSYMVNCCPSVEVCVGQGFEVYISSALDFGTINLSNFHKDKFVLHKKILVCNATKETIIIAPYHDKFTTCDKKSYSLSANQTIAIDFKSVVDLKEGNQRIERPIKIVDYQTKKEKTVWIKAYFINYKE